jgi:hypothetical protein
MSASAAAFSDSRHECPRRLRQPGAHGLSAPGATQGRPRVDGAPTGRAGATLRRVAVAQALARCVPVPLGDIFRNIVAVHPISVKLGNGSDSAGQSAYHPRRLERVGGALLIGSTGYALRRKSAARTRLRICSGVLGGVSIGGFGPGGGFTAAGAAAFRDGLCGFRRRPHHQSRIRPGTCRLAAARPRSMHRGCRETW